MLKTFRWILISVVLAIFAGVWLLSVSISWSMLTWNNDFGLHEANGGDPVLHQHQHLYVEMIGKRVEIYPTWLPHVVAVAGAVMILSGLTLLLLIKSGPANIDNGAVEEEGKTQ